MAGFNTILKNISGIKKYKIALKDEKYYLEKAQQLAKIGYWKLDIINNQLYWSDEIYGIFDLNSEEFNGSYDAFLNNIHPEDRKMVDNAYSDSLKNRTPYEINHRLLLKNGTIKHVIEKCETEYDDKGNPLISIGMVQDITERKKSELELQEREKNLNKAQKITKIGHWELILETNSVAGSDELFRIFDLNRDEFTFKAFIEVVHPEDREFDVNTIQNAIANKQSYSIEHRLQYKSGEIVWIKAMGEPILDEKGNFKSMVGTVQDITERKNLESELIRTNEQFETILDGINAIVYVTDFETHELLFVNQYGKDIFGDISKTSCWESLQIGQSGPCGFCTNSKLLDEHGKPTGVYNWELQNAFNGKYYSIMDRAIRWHDGRFVHLGIASDITEHKKTVEIQKANEKLISLNLAKDELISLVSHELRTPITSILGYAETIVECEVSLGERNKFLITIIEESERLSRLIENFLDVTLYSAETFKFSYKKEKFEQLLENTLGLIKGLATAKNILVKNKVSNIKFIGDGDRIIQVLLNLIGNSIKFSPSGGTIIIDSERNICDFKITIEDEGGGIPEDEIFTVFDKLHRKDRKHGSGGAGLGLYISKQIIEGHKGVIAVTNTKKGAMFHITLPYEQPLKNRQ